MKALTLTQPWATLVALGEKRVETRSWLTTYTGWLAIHAAQKIHPADRHHVSQHPEFALALARHDTSLDDLPRGRVVGVVRLGHCYAIESAWACLWPEGIAAAEFEQVFGNYGPGRFAWTLSKARVVRGRSPEVRGALGLWTVPDDLVLDLGDYAP